MNAIDQSRSCRSAKVSVVDFWTVLSIATGVAGFVIGVLGVWLTVRYARQAKDLHDRLRRLTWNDFLLGSKELASPVRGSGTLDLVLALSPRGATVGNLLLLELGGDVPMVMATNYLHDKRDVPFPKLPEKDWIVSQTNRSLALIPRSMLKDSANRILLVDDWVLSGDMLQGVKQGLTSGGIEKSRIMSAEASCRE